MSPAFTPPSYQFVDFAQVQQMINAAMEPLQKELELIKSLQSEWVDTKVALKMTGLKSAETLKAERERLNTKLIFKLEGKFPKYLRASILAYNEAKTVRRYVGRSL